MDQGQELVQRGADNADLTWSILQKAWEVEECMFLHTMEVYMNGVVRALHLQSMLRRQPGMEPPTQEEQDRYAAHVVQVLHQAYRASALLPEWRARLASGKVRMKLKQKTFPVRLRKVRHKPPQGRAKGLAARGSTEPMEPDTTSLVAKKWVLKPRKAKQVYETSKQIWRSARPDRRTSETRRLEPGGTPRTLLSRRCSSHPWAMEEIEVEAASPDAAAAAAPEAETSQEPVAVETESAHRLWLILLGLVPDGNTLGLTDTDIESLPMTLPQDIVANIEETLSDQSTAELDELREALPEVLDRIREEVIGLSDQASGSSSSAARPPEAEERSERAEPDDTEPLDLTNLMQRTLTGTLKKKAAQPAEAYLQLHQELQSMPAPRASALARKLRGALHDYLLQMPEWTTLEAVLAANSEPPPEASAVEEEGALTLWVEQWRKRLAGSQPEGSGTGAASSWESPPSEEVSTVDVQAEDHEKELQAQNERDADRYNWHIQNAAAEAKRQDEAALQAHLGWSGGSTRKKLRLQIEVTTELRAHYQEIEIGEGESINLKLTPHRQRSPHVPGRQAGQCKGGTGAHCGGRDGPARGPSPARTRTALPPGRSHHGPLRSMEARTDHVGWCGPATWKVHGPLPRGKPDGQNGSCSGTSGSEQVGPEPAQSHPRRIVAKMAAQS